MLTKISNEYLVGPKNNNVSEGVNVLTSQGVIICFGFVMMGIVSDLHNLYFLDPYTRKFRTASHEKIEQVVNQKFISLNWNVIRNLQKEHINRAKNEAKWPLLYLIDFLIRHGIQLFPFIGYTLWLSYFSPLSVLFYIVGITVMIYLYPLPIRRQEDYHEYWERYNSLSTKQFTEIIHHHGNQNSLSMGGVMREMEILRENERLDEHKYFEHINLVFNLIFGANLVLFVISMTDVSEILTYIQYTYIVRNHVGTFGSLYKLYKDTKKQYDKLDEILMKHTSRENISQIVDFSSIQIDDLSYDYPIKNDSTNSFGLRTTNPIKLDAGQCVLISGDSGSGKSTFTDTICGIIPYTEYSAQIRIDDILAPKGFDMITASRIYAEQFEPNCWKPSIFVIITGFFVSAKDKRIRYPAEEELVWAALKMARCDDFMKCVNDDSKGKWIHTKDISPSGGQRGRICIAKIIYFMIKNHPKMVILDEIDKSIQASTAVEILTDIHDYCKSNGIICLVVAHSTEVKNMAYDLVLHFDNGIIS